ncbi:MAG TPA: hypothetical protein VHW00_10195 [Thermoanaerobaculia bacterium]|nr:hypothetical protein [Thermoanaerobaculia bacterium]
MTLRGLGILLLKLWGLKLLVSGLITALGTISMFAVSTERNAQPGVYMMLAGLNIVTMLLLGLLLFLGAPKIVGLLAPEDGDEPGALPNLSAAQVQAIAFAAVGVFFALSALRDIGQLVYAIVRLPEWDETGTYETLIGEHRATLIGAVVQLVAAIVLVWKRYSLALLFEHPRETEPSE